MSHDELFAFEADFVATLRCVPMAVRYKLDAVGVKLSLRQWSRFTVEDRRQLLRLPCTGNEAEGAFRVVLEALVHERAGEPAKALAESPCGSWRADKPPEQVTRHASGVGLADAVDRGWAALSELQRFALVKLSRDNHDNINFAPACREFGITD